jgi:hypothetical protein
VQKAKVALITTQLCVLKKLPFNNNSVHADEVQGNGYWMIEAMHVIYAVN